MGTSGSLGGGGGGAACRGGAGGGRPVLEPEGVGLTTMAGAVAAAGVDWPGRGRAAGLGLETAFGFYMPIQSVL